MIAGRKLIHGVGLNDAGYRISDTIQVAGKQVNIWICPFYRRWEHILKRCYSLSSQKKNNTYLGCSVVPEWFSFKSFRDWMITQPWEGNEIDKDLLIAGNRVYGPDQCVFIPQSLNTFVTNCAKARGEWPVGVSFNKRLGKFVAYCSNPFTGKFDHLGCFISPDAAHEAWRKTKHAHALVYADMQGDQRVSAALRIRYLPENLHKIGI
jgi:hypothetical protein